MEKFKTPHGIRDALAKVKDSPKPQNVLAEGETIEKSFGLKDCQLHATDRRLLQVKGQTILDFDYAHISSVGYTLKRYRWLIILGILIGVGGMFLGEILGDGARIAGAIVGIILVIVGAVAKSERFEVSVVGLSRPVTYRGSGQDLDSLLRIIRRKRIAPTD